ncbi:MAG: hypothetical protein ACK5QH_02570 [Rubrivivax sp.]
MAPGSHTPRAGRPAAALHQPARRGATAWAAVLATVLLLQACGASMPAQSDGWWKLPEGRFKGALDAKRQPTGPGVYELKEGIVEEGTFAGGKLQGPGTRSKTGPNGWRLTGTFTDDKANGPGVMTWSSGHRYDGNFVNGKLEGQGRYRFANGTEYEGAFRADRFNGEGRIRYADGSVYTGGFRDDKRHGEGRLTLASGAIEEGRWADGVHVAGRWLDHTGAEVVGERNGACTVRWPGGGLFEGQCRDWLRWQGTETSASGLIRRVGTWKDRKFFEGYASSANNFPVIPAEGEGRCVHAGEEEPCTMARGERIDSVHRERVAQAKLAEERRLAEARQRRAREEAAAEEERQRRLAADQAQRQQAQAARERQQARSQANAGALGAFAQGFTSTTAQGLAQLQQIDRMAQQARQQQAARSSSAQPSSSSSSQRSPSTAAPTTSRSTGTSAAGNAGTSTASASTAAVLSATVSDSQRQQAQQQAEQQRQEQQRQREAEQREREAKAQREAQERERQRAEAAAQREREKQEREAKERAEKQAAEQAERDYLQALLAGTKLAARKCPDGKGLYYMVGLLPKVKPRPVSCVDVHYHAYCPGTTGTRGVARNFVGISTDCFMGDAVTIEPTPACPVAEVRVEARDVRACGR